MTQSLVRLESSALDNFEEALGVAMVESKIDWDNLNEAQQQWLEINSQVDELPTNHDPKNCEICRLFPPRVPVK